MMRLSETDKRFRNAPEIAADPDMEERFFVQGETVRGEPRIYFVSDRRGKHYASEVTRDRRQAERWCRKMNTPPLSPQSGEPI